MNRELVHRVASAVLYEGYILYPYRPSVKNRQRWTFGGLYPESFCRAFGSGEAPSFIMECLVRGHSDSAIEAAIRFLHLTSRVVGLCQPGEGEPRYEPVESLQVGDRIYHSWQEAE